MKLKNKKSLIYIVLVFIVFLVLGSFAYFLSSDTIENLFVSGTYKTKTTEVFTSPTNWTPGDETPKTITTKNEGTIPVRVRVKLDESWTSKNNETLSLEYNNEKVVIINLDNQNDWLKKGDYYYYTKELAPGESTTSLLKSVTFNPNVEADVTCTFENGVNTCESTGNGYDGAVYRLNITTETVQANKYDKVWENVPIMYDYVGDNPCTYNGELVPGAEYVNGQYTYRYRQEKDLNDWKEITDDGWGVALTNFDSTDPVTSILCSSINNKPIVSMRRTFVHSQASSIDLSSFDTSNVLTMDAMFSGVSATNLDLKYLDTSKVTNMRLMFATNKSQSIDFTNFDTSSVKNMYSMFAKSHATTLDLSSFDTRNVTDMHWMFSEAEVTSLNISSFNTSNVTDMSYMFFRSNLNEIDLSNFDTSKVINMKFMFHQAQATTINLNSFDTSNVTNMNTMFGECNASILDLSSFDTAKVTDFQGMFRDAITTTGYARTQEDASRLNSSLLKPATLTFVVKES